MADDNEVGVEIAVSLALPDGLTAQYPALAGVLDGILREGIRAAQLLAVTAYAEQAPVDTGELSQSFVAGDVQGSTLGGGELFGEVVSPLVYGLVQMDTGRRPGAPISKLGVDAIGLWAQRKLGLSPKEADRAKYAIARAIVQRGLPTSSRSETAAEHAAARIDDYFGVITDNIGAAIASRLAGESDASGSTDGTS